MTQVGWNLPKGQTNIECIKFRIIIYNILVYNKLKVVRKKK